MELGSSLDSFQALQTTSLLLITWGCIYQLDPLSAKDWAAQGESIVSESEEQIMSEQWSTPNPVNHSPDKYYIIGPN